MVSADIAAVEAAMETHSKVSALVYDNIETGLGNLLWSIMVYCGHNGIDLDLLIQTTREEKRAVDAAP